MKTLAPDILVALLALEEDAESRCTWGGERLEQVRIWALLVRQISWCDVGRGYLHTRRRELQLAAASPSACMAHS